MPKCPICGEDLKELDNQNLECTGCGETIPKEYGLDPKIVCCNPLNPCK